MKKLLLLLLTLFIITPITPADDLEFPSMQSDDLWDNWNTREEGKEAKPVSDAEFEKALEQVDKKVNKWKNWAKRRQIPKGSEYNQSNETEVLNNNYGTEKADPVICIPVEVKIGDGTLPIGHYQVRGKITDGNVILELYQSNQIFAQIKATETDDDFGADSISFAKWDAVDDDKLKIEFGSLELNAYAILDIEK